MQAKPKTPKRGDVVLAPIAGHHPAVVLAEDKAGAVLCLLVMGGTGSKQAEQWESTCVKVARDTRYAKRMGLSKDTSFKAGDLHWFEASELKPTNNHTCPSELLVEMDALHEQVIAGQIKVTIGISPKVREARRAVVESPIAPSKGDD